MAASKNTIRVWTEVPKKEAIAYEGITPGMLVERLSSTSVKKHASDGAAAYPFLIAEEDELQGKEITDAYTAADQIFFMAPLRGDLVMVLLADGENVADGDLLASSGDGLFVKAAGGDIPLCRAMEAKNLSATANTTNEHILVEVL